MQTDCTSGQHKYYRETIQQFVLLSSITAVRTNVPLFNVNILFLANIVLIFKNNVGVCRTNINIGNTNYVTLTGNQCVILNLSTTIYFNHGIM